MKNVRKLTRGCHRLSLSIQSHSPLLSGRCSVCLVSHSLVSVLQSLCSLRRPLTVAPGERGIMASPWHLWPRSTRRGAAPGWGDVSIQSDGSGFPWTCGFYAEIGNNSIILPLNWAASV